MKQTLLTLSLILSTLLSFSQAFEGEIVYHNTYKSKTPGLKDEQLNTMMGSVQYYFVKGGNYKSETNGSFMLWQLYSNTDNKLYNKLASSPVILWNDATSNADTVLSSSLHKGVTTILGYQCDELVLNCRSGVQKYYFSTKLPVDAKLYAHHNYGNYYAYLQKTNALPLKVVIDNAQLTMEGIATEVKPMKLDKAKFMLPQGVQTAKSPY